jgi:hypothetical protein
MSDAAVGGQQYRCTLSDGTPQMADRDLSRDFPLAVRACRPASARQSSTVVLQSTRSSTEGLPAYRCTLSDGSLQMADRDLSIDFRLAVKSCRPISGLGRQAVIVRSVDTPVTTLAVVAPEPPDGATDDGLDDSAEFPAREGGSVSREPAAPAVHVSLPPAPSGPAAEVLGTARPSRRAAAQPIASLIQAAAKRQGLDPGMVSALVYVESRYNPLARSHAGAIGLMQIMPATGARYGVSSPRALLDPNVNVDVGTRYLRDLTLMFPGRKDLVLAAYNAGEAAVRKYGNRIPPYKETQSYVLQIMTLWGGEAT